MGQSGQRPKKALGFLLSYAYKRFEGKVPEPGPLDEGDQALLGQVEAGFDTVGDLYNACKFRAAPSALLRVGLGEALALAREANGDTFATLSAGLDEECAAGRAGAAGAGAALQKAG